MTKHPAILSLRNISVRRNRNSTPVVGVNLELTNAFTSVMGVNGAGKTTLFMALVGLLPFDGELLADGEPLSRRWGLDNVGYCPQSVVWPSRLTARQVCETAADLRGVPRSQRTESVRSSLAVAGAESFADVRCGRLSGGQRRRVSLAQSLVHDPSILVLDEPTSELDPLFCDYFAETVTALAESRRLIVSTHMLDDVERWPGDVVVMSTGSATHLTADQLGADRRSTVASVFRSVAQ